MKQEQRKEKKFCFRETQQQYYTENVIRFKKYVNTRISYIFDCDMKRQASKKARKRGGKR